MIVPKCTKNFYCTNKFQLHCIALELLNCAKNGTTVRTGNAARDYKYATAKNIFSWVFHRIKYKKKVFGTESKKQH